MGCHRRAPTLGRASQAPVITARRSRPARRGKRNHGAPDARYADDFAHGDVRLTMPLDVASLLAPLAEDAPAGDNLEYDAA